MTLLVLCFSGRIGSGKTSVSQLVADNFKAAWTSFGDFMRAYASAESLDPTSREVLQDLGQRLLNTYGTRWLCEQVVARANLSGGGVLVIDGIRHVDVADCIKEMFSPSKALFIHLELSGGIERSRDLDAATRVHAESHSTERDVLGPLSSYADLVVYNDASLDVVVRSIVQFVQRYLSESPST